MTIQQQLLAGSAGAIALAVSFSAYGPRDEPAAPMIAAASVTGEQSGPAGVISSGSISAQIQTLVAASSAEPLTHAEQNDDPIGMALREAYAIRVYDPIWTHDGAEALRNRVEAQAQNGFPVQPGLIERIDAAERHLRGSGEERARADLFLSQVFLQLATRERNGIDPDLVAIEGLPAEVDPQPLREQLAFAGQDDFNYRSFDPVHPEYAALLDARRTYVGYAEAGGFTRIPDIDEPLEVGDTDPVIATLRERLGEEGYDVHANALGSIAFFVQPDTATASPEAETLEGIEPGAFDFTPELELALIEFQRRNGLETDGILGPNTIAALNVTAEEKVARIDTNIERWRWAPADFGSTHVRVNIPAYRAEGYQDGREAIEMRAIVGMTSRQTPVFTDTIEYVVANPNWYVPENILSADKLDDIRSDVSYISSHNFYVLDRETGEAVSEYEVDWNAPGVENRYRLVQRPGSGNALGPVKIMFPNEHAVYLHGTPGEQLFARSRRAFSSGCVRLEQPEQMARWVLEAGGTGDRIADIDQAWTSRQNERFDLAESIPVYMTYFTVEVDDDGHVLFHEDIYDRDTPVIQALATRGEFGVPAISEA